MPLIYPGQMSTKAGTRSNNQLEKTGHEAPYAPWLIDTTLPVLFNYPYGGAITFANEEVKQNYGDAVSVVDAGEYMDQLEQMEKEGVDITQSVIEQGDGPNKMDTSTDQKLVNGHRIVHGWYDHPSKTSWSKDQVIKEHTRLVRVMLKRGMKHDVHDALDETLPADLKKQSKATTEKKPNGK